MSFHLITWGALGVVAILDVIRWVDYMLAESERKIVPPWHERPNDD